MFDFAADARDQGGEPGMNHKGLVTFDRKTKKDSFYLYKAWWSDEAFVHICSKRFADRTASEIEVKVYSNQKTVALFADGQKIAEQTGEHVFTFKVPLNGEASTRHRSVRWTPPTPATSWSRPSPRAPTGCKPGRIPQGKRRLSHKAGYCINKKEENP